MQQPRLHSQVSEDAQRRRKNLPPASNRAEEGRREDGKEKTGKKGINQFGMTGQDGGVDEEGLVCLPLSHGSS